MEQEQDSSLRDTFSAAKANRKNFESFTSSADPIYQENLRSAIEVLEQCRRIAGRISLFSPNEILEDVSSADIQYVWRMRNHLSLLIASQILPH